VTLDERLHSAVFETTLPEEESRALLQELSSYLYRYDLPISKIVDYIDLITALKLKYSALHIRELFDFLQTELNINIIERMLDKITDEFNKGDFSSVNKLCEILSLPEYYKYGDIWRKSYILVLKAVVNGAPDEILLKVLHLKRI
jgi:hypothetical protein